MYLAPVSSHELALALSMSREACSARLVSAMTGCLKTTGVRRYRTQVEAVMYAVVPKRGEVLLIDGIPNPQLRCYAAIEVVKHVETIRPFRSRCEPKEFDGLHMLKQRCVRRCGGMVELVDDDHVKVSWVE